ncbi:MAG: hypothetical protein R3C49_24345 [Planctomycetaceae bacterium]
MKHFTLALAALVTLTTSSIQATDFSGVSSGLLLGVYASPAHGGMRVTSTIPGYSAEGRLFPGDVLLRTTIDGWQMYRLRTHYEMENAKSAIGAGQQAALEIYRPGEGLIYAWVEFTPIYGPATAYSVQSGQPNHELRRRFEWNMKKEELDRCSRRMDGLVRTSRTVLLFRTRIPIQIGQQRTCSEATEFYDRSDTSD